MLFHFQQFIFSLNSAPKHRGQEILLVTELRQRKHKVLQPKLKGKLFPECATKCHSVMIIARKFKKLHHLGVASDWNVKPMHYFCIVNHL